MFFNSSLYLFFFFFSSRRRHTRCGRDWSSDVCSSDLLWLALAVAYRPARRDGLSWMRRFLFYYPYLAYISRFPFREIHHIVHDHLAAPVVHYLRRELVEQWYRSVGARDAVITWHNRNSWRGYGQMPAVADAEAAGGRTP